MKTAEQKAIKLVDDFVAFGLDVNATTQRMMERLLERTIKEQDRDTRHACAEACMAATTNSNLEIVSKAYHDICMNVKAV